MKMKLYARKSRSTPRPGVTGGVANDMDDTHGGGRESVRSIE